MINRKQLRRAYDFLPQGEKVEWLIFGAIYIISLVITINGIPAMPVSDRLSEYQSYQAVIANNGIIDFNAPGLVNSSLITIWLPAKIHLLTNINSLTLFNALPCLIYPLMPAFAYLISRKHLSIYGAIISAGLILSFFYFAYSSDGGRLSIAWGILAALIWAILYDKKVLIAIFAILLTLSHYGTSSLFLFISASATTYLLISLFWKARVKRELLTISITTLVLGVSIFIWYGYFAPITGNVIKRFIISGVTFNSPTLIDESGLDSKLDNFMKLESRDPVVQAAFGKTFPAMNTPQRIEFALSWLIVILITYGLYCLFRHKVFSLTHRLLALVFYMAIILTVIIPHFGMWYGVVRVYFTGLAVLSPCFYIGTREVSKIFRIKEYILPAIIVLVYALCVSGITHSIFGISK